MLAFLNGKNKEITGIFEQSEKVTEVGGIKIRE